MAKCKICAWIIGAVLLTSGIASVDLCQEKTTDPKTIVAGIEAGNLTKEQLTEKLNSDLAPKLDEPVLFKLGRRTYQVKRSDLGISIDMSKMVTYAIDEPGNVKNNHWVPISLTVDSGKLREYVEKEIAPHVARSGVNAKLYISQGVFQVIPGANGRKLDVNSAVAPLIANPAIQKVSLRTVPTPPHTTAADLSQIDTLIAHYETRFRPSVVGRTQNLKLAAKMINGTCIKPGETFSFNGIVGERSASRGFQMAHVFVKNEVILGLGGGMCQLASTLYNLALQADMKIVERHPHMFMVTYVPSGQDAAVAYGSKDFKFQNNTSNPVYLYLKVNGATVYSSIYGADPSKHQIEIKSVKTIDEDKIIHTKVYRVVKENGIEISKELLTRNSYKKQPKTSH